jgi:hypothetical protein
VRGGSFLSFSKKKNCMKRGCPGVGEIVFNAKLPEADFAKILNTRYIG